MKNFPQALTFSLKPQIWSFHVVVLLTTTKKMDKIEEMHVQSVQSSCFCQLNMQICDVLVAVTVVVAKTPCCFDEYAGEKCSKMRATRASRSFWFFQPIILLLFGDVVAVVVVVS